MAAALIRRLAAPWGLLAATLACGYAPLSGGPLAEGRRVWIATLRNDTAEVAVEARVSDALRRELLRRGDARLVADRRRADLRVQGAVSELRGRSRTFSSDVRALEVELWLRLVLDVRDAAGREIPLDPHALSARETYLSSPDLEVQRRHRREAIDRLARILAERLVRELLWSGIEPGQGPDEGPDEGPDQGPDDGAGRERGSGRGG